MGCFSCLTSDRRLTSIRKYRRMFELIIADTSLNISDLKGQDIRVCWECKATVRKCYEFAQKVQNAQMANMPVLNKSCIKTSLSRLKVVKMKFVDILSEEETYEVPIVKIEHMENDDDSAFNTDSIEISKESHTELLRSLDVSSKGLLETDTPSCTKRRKFNSAAADANQNNFSKIYKTKDYDLDSTKCAGVSYNLNTVKKEIDNKQRTTFQLPYSNWTGAVKKNIELINIVYKRSTPKTLDKSQKRLVMKAINLKPHLKVTNLVKKDKTVKDTPKHREKSFDYHDKFKLSPMTEKELVQNWNAIRKSEDFVSSKIKCDKCLVTYKVPSLLETHMKKHLPKTGLVKCRICEVYMSPSGLHKHEGFHYKKYDCLLCDHVSYFSAKQAWRHFNACHFGTNVKCDKCDERFSSASKYKIHHNETHNAVATCEQCKQTFSKLQYYINHMKNHTTCKKCSLSFDTLDEYRKHCSQVHQPKAVTTPGFCAECNIQFKDMACYYTHLKNTLVHANEGENRSFECDLCGKKFRLKSLLKSHIKYVHMTDMKKCPHCPRAFRKPSSYNRHIKVVHEGYQVPRSHVCDQCGKGFTNKKVLSEHMTVHTRERPHKCSLCSKTFGFSAALFTHKRVVHRMARKREINTALADNSITTPE